MTIRPSTVFERLSLRQVSICVLVLGVLNWAGLQFVILPKMTVAERREIYSGWMSTPYPDVAGLIFICSAAWFLAFYRGTRATHGIRIAICAMASGAFYGMLMILAIRIAWHI